MDVEIPCRAEKPFGNRAAHIAQTNKSDMMELDHGAYRFLFSVNAPISAQRNVGPSVNVVSRNRAATERIVFMVNDRCGIQT
jgi:hypothetical protein